MIYAQRCQCRTSSAVAETKNRFDSSINFKGESYNEKHAETNLLGVLVSHCSPRKTPYSLTLICGFICTWETCPVIPTCAQGSSLCALIRKNHFAGNYFTYAPLSPLF